MNTLSNLFDYLDWRGDLSLAAVPFTSVDGLILSTLAYVHFESLLAPDLKHPITIAQAAERFLALPEQRRVRCKADFELLKKLCHAPRFAKLKLAFYDERFVPEKEMQFAAMAVLLTDGSAFLAFRGTDSTLVGWKEDFNMSFQDVVPAQLAALEYTEQFAAAFEGPLYLGGHSKGGNLAVFAAAQCHPSVRQRIRAVYNNDGPGFTPYVLGCTGYRELLPRIHTFVPQSSVIGMLLEHEDPYTVVKSNKIGILQHDPYSWEVLGGDFVRLETVTAGSRMTDRVVKNWVASLSPEERGRFIDTAYELLSAGGTGLMTDFRQPRKLYAVLQAMKGTDEASRRLLTDTLRQLMHSTMDALREQNH